METNKKILSYNATILYYLYLLQDKCLFDISSDEKRKFNLFSKERYGVLLDQLFLFKKKEIEKINEKTSIEKLKNTILILRSGFVINKMLYNEKVETDDILSSIQLIKNYNSFNLKKKLDIIQFIQEIDEIIKEDFKEKELIILKIMKELKNKNHLSLQDICYVIDDFHKGN